ncbi:ribosomal large subunit pseudouridine synthase C [Luminiphilus syltensis NOR5-1B]|uniref:Pseudouridine synthase n=1 Tax=Luminiphilus syltensis NOR5-1B TaxID=565045 RepID=B8KQV7_9GAMM|nr:RluA family pseudouridine synthase [Luminiphilus syltensis]EED35138.1 ribosomal large subunit pseudouridine synthase C [Luminiphilus syltensis NOR5-1B]
MSENRVSARLVTVTEEESGQRLDNYLLRTLQGVPKTRLYRAVRKGEVRVNKGRAKVDLRLKAGDTVRLPPLVASQPKGPAPVSGRWRKAIGGSIVLDTADLLALNKPSGLAVHGGSGVDVGLIESLRAMFPEQRYLELVHRLDRDTSGLILVAKRASVLRDLHAQLRDGEIDKRYQCLVSGRWPAYLKQVDGPLERYSLASGERRVRVSVDGKPSLTRFRVLERFQDATLLEAKPVSGRTHQIRVHALQAGHPILGDAKYSNAESEALTAAVTANRLFLHAESLRFKLGDHPCELSAPLDSSLRAVLERLRSRGN